MKVWNNQYRVVKAWALWSPTSPNRRIVAHTETWTDAGPKTLCGWSGKGMVSMHVSIARLFADDCKSCKRVKGGKA